MMPREPCIAGPSKSKPPPELELPTTKQEPVKAKVRQSSSFMSADQAKEKHNGTEKLNFFTKGKDTKNVKLPDNVKKVKKEGSVVDFNKQIFFLKPTKETVDESASVKEEERIRKKPSSVSILNLYLHGLSDRTLSTSETTLRQKQKTTLQLQKLLLQR